MKVLVTGANGYLGQGVVRQLLDDGIEVIAADFRLDNVDKRAVHMACDLFALENPYAYFGYPDVLLHMAWRDGFVHNSPNHMLDLPNHYCFLDCMIAGGIQQIAVMGSMHEVGFYEGSIKEDTPCHPLSLYGISKNALRDALQVMTAGKNIKIQWLRGYYIVGNSKYGNSVFSKITAAVAEGKKHFPFTMGLNQFDFVDYEDFCIQVAAVVQQSEVCGIINICSGRPEKLSDRVERFIWEEGYDIQLDYGAFPDRPYDSKCVWGDTRKEERIWKMYKSND